MKGLKLSPLDFFELEQVVRSLNHSNDRAITSALREIDRIKKDSNKNEYQLTENSHLAKIWTSESYEQHRKNYYDSIVARQEISEEEQKFFKSLDIQVEKIEAYHLYDSKQHIQMTDLIESYKKRTINILEGLALKVKYEYDEQNKDDIEQSIQKDLNMLKDKNYNFISRDDVFHVLGKYIDTERKVRSAGSSNKLFDIFQKKIYGGKLKFFGKFSMNEVIDCSDLISQTNGFIQSYLTSVEQDVNGESYKFIQVVTDDYLLTENQRDDFERVIRLANKNYDGLKLDEQLQNVFQDMPWFNNMSQAEKLYLLDFMKENKIIAIDNTKPKMYQFKNPLKPTPLVRKMPLVANYSHHQQIVLKKNNQGEFKLQGKYNTERCGIEFPMDYQEAYEGKKKQGKAYRYGIKSKTEHEILSEKRSHRAVTKENIKQNIITALENLVNSGDIEKCKKDNGVYQVNYLLQTLMSAKKDISTTVLDYEKQMLDVIHEIVEEDRDEKYLSGYYEIGGKKINLNLLHLNRPINQTIKGFEKGFGIGSQSKADKNKKDWLEVQLIVENYIKSKGSSPIGDLKQLMGGYASVCAQEGLLTSEKYSEAQREYNYSLHKAAMECVLFDEMGSIARTGCKSGKDRTGVIIAYIDTINQYRVCYGKVFDILDETQHEQFYQLLANNLVLRREQIKADYAAAGCKGLKALQNILPEVVFKKVLEKDPSYFLQNKALSELNRGWPIIKAIQRAKLIKEKPQPSVKLSGAAAPSIASPISRSTHLDLSEHFEQSEYVEYQDGKIIVQDEQYDSFLKEDLLWEALIYQPKMQVEIHAQEEIIQSFDIEMELSSLMASIENMEDAKRAVQLYVALYAGQEEQMILKNEQGVILGIDKKPLDLQIEATAKQCDWLEQAAKEVGLNQVFSKRSSDCEETAMQRKEQEGHQRLMEELKARSDVPSDTPGPGVNNK